MIRVPGRSIRGRKFIASDLGPLTINHLSASFPDGAAFRVSWVDYPDGSVGLNWVDGMLDAAARVLPEGNSWTIRDWDLIQLGGHPGREVLAECRRRRFLRAGFRRHRSYFVGRRLYQVIVVDLTARGRPEDFDPFFRSFTLIGDVPGRLLDADPPPPESN